MESDTIACLQAGLLSSPSLSLHNPPGWNMLQVIMLLGETASACAGFGQPSTTPMSSFSQDPDMTYILIKVTHLAQLDPG